MDSMSSYDLLISDWSWTPPIEILNPLYGVPSGVYKFPVVSLTFGTVFEIKIARSNSLRYLLPTVFLL